MRMVSMRMERFEWNFIYNKDVEEVSKIHNSVRQLGVVMGSQLKTGYNTDKNKIKTHVI